VSNKSLNSRINKFIFHESNVFLRLKTNAKDLKVVKDVSKKEADYHMQIPTPSNGEDHTAIPVIWINDFNDSTLLNDAKTLGFAERSLENASTKIQENWGLLTKLKDSKANFNYYYLSPKNKNYAVKIGPIHQGIDGTKIKIDWSNLQWGER